MIQKFKLLSFSFFFVLSLVGVSFETYNVTIADDEAWGCTDPFANNYNPDATREDGSCTYTMGCTNPAAGNYNPSAQRDDGSCTYPGCTDSNACNYNQSAVGDDGSCEYESCLQACPTGTHGTPPNCINNCSDDKNWNPDTQQCEYPLCPGEGDTTHRSNITGECTCDNGAGNPPLCNDYCTDSEANNHGSSLPCTYDGPGCCADPNALNTDNPCPDTSIHSHSDPVICTYCTPTSDNFACRVDHCAVLRANNYQSAADCQTANPNMRCVANSFSCQYDTLYYCSDPAALPPNGNSTSLADCNLNKVDSRQLCVEDNPRECNYPGDYYCNDNRANNYDENGAQCSAAHPNSACTDDNSECQYSYCTVGFSLDIECPSGFKFKTPDDMSYWYTFQYSPFSPYNEYCEGFTFASDQTDALKTYFEQKYCGAGLPATCASGFCGNIDWCPNTPGVQTDPTECVDFCPDTPGIQTSEDQCNTCPAGQYLNSSNVCVPCTGGNCNLVNGICGLADTESTVASSTSIHNAYACESGVSSGVSLNSSTYNWNCAGRNGGTNDSCNASLQCGSGTTWCYGVCKTSCEVGKNAGQNDNLDGYDDSVDLNTLKVAPPIVSRGDSCVVSWGNGTNVFNSYASTSAEMPTHCRLQSQDGAIGGYTFDPGDVSAPTTYTKSNVLKDMIYSLKCWDGAEDQNTLYRTASGSCRLNINTKELN